MEINNSKQCNTTIFNYASVSFINLRIILTISESKHLDNNFSYVVYQVELLIRIHHKNLVSLLGYCEEGNVLAIVYEYMANGDLKELLSG